MKLVPSEESLQGVRLRMLWRCVTNLPFLRDDVWFLRKRECNLKNLPFAIFSQSNECNQSLRRVDCHGKAKPSRRSLGLDREPTATRWCMVKQSCIRSIEIEREQDDPTRGSQSIQY